MEHKKYTVSYCSGATGYGWEQEYDRLDEFESFVDYIRQEYTAYLDVWDNTLHDFIFLKRVLTYTPEIDLLQRHDRDMRTTSRKRKG